MLLIVRDRKTSQQQRWASGEGGGRAPYNVARTSPDFQSQLPPVTLHRPLTFIQFPHLHIDRRTPFSSLLLHIEASNPWDWSRKYLKPQNRSTIRRAFNILFCFKTHPWTCVCHSFCIRLNLLCDLGWAGHSPAWSSFCKPHPWGTVYSFQFWFL